MSLISRRTGGPGCHQWLEQSPRGSRLHLLPALSTTNAPPSAPAPQPLNTYAPCPPLCTFPPCSPTHATCKPTPTPCPALCPVRPPPCTVSHSAPHPACLHTHEVVVEIHTGSQILARPPTQELLDELAAVLEIVPAATPLPGLSVLQVRGLITSAALHAACTARLGQCMRQASRGDGVKEGCLLEAWGGGGRGRSAGHSGPRLPQVQPNHGIPRHTFRIEQGLWEGSFLVCSMQGGAYLPGLPCAPGDRRCSLVPQT